jgi:hypothetical protein
LLKTVHPLVNLLKPLVNLLKPLVNLLKPLLCFLAMLLQFIQHPRKFVTAGKLFRHDAFDKGDKLRVLFKDARQLPKYILLDFLQRDWRLGHKFPLASTE